MPEHIRENVIAWNWAAYGRAQRGRRHRDAARHQRNIRALAG